MTMNLSGDETFAPTGTGERSLGMRVIARTISIIAGIARAIGHEVACMIREELYHAQIQRDREDWER